MNMDQQGRRNESVGNLPVRRWTALAAALLLVAGCSGNQREWLMKSMTHVWLMQELRLPNEQASPVRDALGYETIRPAGVWMLWPSATEVRPEQAPGSGVWVTREIWVTGKDGEGLRRSMMYSARTRLENQGRKWSIAETEFSELGPVPLYREVVTIAQFMGLVFTLIGLLSLLLVHRQADALEISWKCALFITLLMTALFVALLLVTPWLMAVVIATFAFLDLRLLYLTLCKSRR